MDFDLDKEYEEKDIKKEPKPVDDGFDIFSDVENSDDESSKKKSDRKKDRKRRSRSRDRKERKRSRERRRSKDRSRDGNGGSFLLLATGQGISLIGRVPIEILPGKRYIT